MHSLICGVTLTGKTTLARHIASGLCARGHRVFVYDPMIGTGTAGADDEEPWGKGAIIFADEDSLVKAMHENDREAHVFIDESDELFSHSRKENFWILTRGRHFLLSVNLITQRPKMISPTVRRQCTKLYMFSLAHDDTKEIAKDYAFDGDELLEKDGVVVPLDKGDFVVVVSGEHSKTRANIFQLLKSKRRMP